MKKLIFGFLSLIFLPTALWAGDFGAIGAPICGYGKYRIGNTCYEYGAQNDTSCDADSVTGNACLAAFVESSGGYENLSPFSAGYATFGALFNVENPADATCGGAGVTGTACLAAFVESAGGEPSRYPFSSGIAVLGAPSDVKTTADEFCGRGGVSGNACLYAFIDSSGVIPTRYPFSGGIATIGSPSTAFENMKAKDCLGTMDGYYVTNVNWFSPMVKAACPSGTENYVIPNDCQYIDMANTDASDIHSPLNPENWMCGVLCDTGALYTGTGACSMPCTTDGIKRRLHIKNETYEFSVPLYSDKLTSPAMNFSIYDTSESTAKRCYMNLFPRSGTNKVVVEYKGTKYYSSR